MPTNTTLGTTAPNRTAPDSFTRQAPRTSPTLTNAFDPAADTSNSEGIYNAIASGAKAAAGVYVGYQAEQVEEAATEISQIARLDRTGQLSVAQAEQLARTSALFRKYAQARRQGAMTDTAADIAVESELKRVASAFPMLAEDVRAEATTAMGFDPTGSQYDFLTEGPNLSANATLSDKLRVKAQEIGAATGMDSEAIFEMMMDNQLNEIRLNSLQQKASLNKLGLSDSVQKTQLEVSSVIDQFRENILFTMNDEGVDDITQLSPQAIAGMQGNLRRIQTRMIDQLRSSLAGQPGATASFISARVKEVRSRFDTFITGLDYFSNEKIVSAEYSTRKKLADMYIKGMFPVINMFEQLGAQNPVQLGAAVVGTDSPILQNMAQYSAAIDVVTGKVGDIQKFSDTLGAIFSGNSGALLSSHSRRDAVGMAKSVAAGVVRGNLGESEASAGALETLRELGELGFVMEDVVSNPGNFVNNKAVTTFLKNRTSTMATNQLALAIQEAGRGNIRLTYGDGRIQVEVDPSSLPPNTTIDEAKLRVWGDISQQLLEIEQYAGSLNNNSMARAVGESTQEYIRSMNEALSKDLTASDFSTSARDLNREMFPVSAGFVRSIAVEEGVDPDLAVAVARQESALGAADSAMSSAGAVGIMQLMPGTARDLGLVVSEDGTIDERYNEEKNTRAGVQYLSKLSKKYDGDYVLVTAAYNWGLGNVDNLLKSNNDTTIQDIPQETRDYVKDITGVDIVQYLRNRGLVEVY